MTEQRRRPSVFAEHRYLRAMERLRGARPIVMEISPTLANLLVAELQLALRHPRNTGLSAELIAELAHSIEDRLCELEPDLREVLELGWDPDYDQPPPRWEAT